MEDGYGNLTSAPARPAGQEVPASWRTAAIITWGILAMAALWLALNVHHVGRVWAVIL